MYMIYGIRRKLGNIWNIWIEDKGTYKRIGIERIRVVSQENTRTMGLLQRGQNVIWISIL